MSTKNCFLTSLIGSPCSDRIITTLPDSIWPYLVYDLVVRKGQLRCRDASSHPSSILGVVRCLRLSQVSRKKKRHTGSIREIERFWETSRNHFHVPATLVGLASICKSLSTWSTWRNSKKNRDKLAKWIEPYYFFQLVCDVVATYWCWD